MVDDEPQIARMLTDILEEYGYRVSAFDDSRKALDWATQQATPPDALVTDQTMPGMSGFELARHLRTRWPGLPVILCTGYSEVVDAAVCAGAGIDAFLYKPIPVNDLLGALRRALAPAERHQATS